MSSDRDALLERHRPLLKYDSNESYFADSAAIWTDWKANRLMQGGDLIAASASVDGKPKLSLSLLAPDEYDGQTTVKSSDLIDCGGNDYAAAARELHQVPRYRNRMYGRAVEDDGHWWLQYWFFYFYNDFNLIGSFFGAGLHEGDWEMVQLRLDENEVPDYAVYAQHKEAEVRRWDQVDVLPGAERPFVYVARGSHASYFSPGKHSTGAWWDFADGARRSPDVRLEIVDERQDEWRWLLWPGYWGGTKKPKISLPFDADSPVGPHRHDQWDRPSKLAPDLPAAAAPVAQPAVPSAPPSLSKAQARREGRNLLVDYEAAAPEGQGLRGLVVTVNSPDEPGVPPLTRTIEADALTGTVEWPGEIDPGKHYDVHVSAAFDDHTATPARRTDLAPSA